MLQLFAFIKTNKNITKRKKKLIPCKLESSLPLLKKSSHWSKEKEKVGMSRVKLRGLIKLFCVLVCFQHKRSCREGTITEGEMD